MSEKEINETLKSIWNKASIPQRVYVVGKDKRDAKLKMKDLMNKIKRDDPVCPVCSGRIAAHIGDGKCLAVSCKKGCEIPKDKQEEILKNYNERGIPVSAHDVVYPEDVDYILCDFFLLGKIIYMERDGVRIYKCSFDDWYFSDKPKWKKV